MSDHQTSDFEDWFAFITHYFDYPSIVHEFCAILSRGFSSEGRFDLLKLLLIHLVIWKGKVARLPLHQCPINRWWKEAEGTPIDDSPSSHLCPIVKSPRQYDQMVTCLSVKLGNSMIVKTDFYECTSSYDIQMMEIIEHMAGDILLC